MRIAVVNSFFPPRVGGSAHLSEVLALEYARAGHEVLVITTRYRDAPAEERYDGIRVVRLPSWKLPRMRLSIDFDIAFASRPGNVRRIRRLLDEFRPDVLHQHGQFFDLTWMTGLYGHRRKIPTLLSVHTRLENPKPGYNALFAFLDTTLVRFFLGRYRPDFVVMDRLMDRYIRNRYRADEGRLVAIPVGVEPSRFVGTTGTDVRAAFELGKGPIILSLGHVIPVRDRVDLVKALPLVRKTHPDVRVVVVGEVHYPKFLELAAELGVDDLIKCVGPQPKPAIPDFMAAADVEVHDLQGYGLGTASLEAMAAGLPVVAAVRSDNFPGLQLRDGEVCLLVPLHDDEALAGALDRLLSDAELRARIGAASRSFVLAHFTVEQVANAHLDHLAAMTARQKPQAPPAAGDR